MGKDKLDQLLEEIGFLKAGQQNNYDLIQKNGIKLEQVASDIKAVAEGHAVLNRKIDTKFDELRENLGGQISDLKSVIENHSLDIKEMKADIKEIKKDLHEHVRLPASLAHAAV